MALQQLGCGFADDHEVENNSLLSASVGQKVGPLHAIDINARLARCIEHMS